MDAVKDSSVGVMFFILACLACKVFPDIISDKIMTAISNRMQLLFTNVKGPTTQKRFGGRKVKSLQFWPPAKGEVTGGLSILSFNSQFQVSEMSIISYFEKI